MKPPAPQTRAVFRSIGVDAISLLHMNLCFYEAVGTRSACAGLLRASFRQATALRVKRHHPPASDRAHRAISALQFSCRRRKRRTVKRDRNRRAHHLKQNLHPTGRIQPLQRAHEVGKWP